MKPLGLLLVACLACEAAVPVRLQVVLSSASVRVNASFNAKIELVDAHALPAQAPSPCAVTVTVLDADNNARVQQVGGLSIAPGAVSTGTTLVLRKAGFYAIRASTACPRIQEGQIYVRATSGSAELWQQPRFLLVAQTQQKGNIDVFYPQDANSLTADGKNKAQIQVFVAPPINFSLAFDSGATISPNPLMFAAGAGDATANLTSTQPGDFTAIVSPSSIPRGYAVHTHPTNPPMHHFLPDIEFLQVTASSEHGVPLNSPVTLTVQLLDGQKHSVNAVEPVPVNLRVNPGSAIVKENPLTIVPGQSTNHTTFTAPESDHYSIDADWGDAKSIGPAKINVTAPIGFFAILAGGIVGGCISCIWSKKFQWQQLVYGGMAATAVWLVSGIGVFAIVSASMVSNSWSAAVLGALAGLAGEQVLTLIEKKLFGVDKSAPPPPAAAEAGGAG